MERKIKLSLFADDMIIYIENPKIFFLKNRTSKQIQQRYGIQKTYKKSVTFVYMNNELSKKEIFRIILTKEVKGMYTESYKMLMKEIKENT